jgi:hypothetical protein
VLRVIVQPTSPGARKEKLVDEARGFNVHAERLVDGRDRPQLERLWRYLARPPLCTERLQLRPDGRLRLELKTPWADGTTAIVLAPLDLITRLCALVPPPRFNLTRFHGVLASAAKLRSEVVPQPVHHEPAAPVQLPLFGTTRSLGLVKDSHDNQRYPAGRHPWAWLMKRVFQRDVTVCPRCQGPMTIREVALTAESITRVLARHGLAPQPPPTPPMPKWVDPTQRCLSFA